MLTKKILGFKNFYMSFSLSLLILFSVIYCGYSITLGVILFSLFMFLNMSINTTFYDLKDMELDKQQKLRTLPLYLGKKRFLKVLHVLNVVSFVPLVLGVWLAVLPVFTLILFVMFVSGFYYIQKAFDPQANLDFLSYVVVDGQYYLLLILVFIGTFACGFS